MELLCKCGCGKPVTSKIKCAQFVHGHGQKNKKLTADHRAKIGARHKGKIVSEETREKLRQVNLGNTLSPEIRKKISDAQKGKPGKPHTTETRKKLSAIKKQEWANGKYDKAFKNYSSYEERLAPIVEKLGFKASFKERLYIKKDNKRGKAPDFYNEKTKEIIEIFGEYWHKRQVLPNGKKHKTPEEVIAWYAEAGWKCRVIWAESEFEDFYKEMVERVEQKQKEDKARRDRKLKGES